MLSQFERQVLHDERPIRYFVQDESRFGLHTIIGRLITASGVKPIERLWEHIKADLKWDSFKTLTQLQTKVDRLLKELTPEVIASITGYSFILDALSALNTI